MKPANPVDAAILTRRTVRGFLPQPVAPDTINELLAVAARAPSGSNIQPWHVHVLTGDRLEALKAALSAAFDSGEPEAPEYHYYPVRWRSPYLERRRELGWALYTLAGVRRGDREAGRRQHARNYRFFDAPVGLIYVIDRDLELGSWLDFGMFLENFMVAARGRDLDTCPLQSIANYPKIVAAHVPITAGQMIVCGMGLGVADPDEPANQLVTTRAAVEDFASFHGD